MAIANVIRVSILGASPGGEVWSVNPVWQIGGVSTSEDVSSAQANAMAAAVAAIVVPAGLTAALSTSFTVTGCRVEARRWDGTLAAQGEALKATPTPGTGSTGHPFQTSIVASLRTGEVGARGRGRLYWPATGMPLTVATLRPAAGPVDSVVTGFKTYLTSIGAALDVSLTNSPVLSVWSRTYLSTAPVTSIQAGDILDVQRRRRDQLIETYQSTTYP